MVKKRDQVVCPALAAILLVCGGVRAEEPSLAPLDVQGRIDAVVAAGGGEVRIGPGDYEAKPFVLKSGVTLNLLEGATVYASTNVADYAAARGERCFIFAEGATNVSIVGKGTLNGRGWAFRESRGLSGESQPQDLPVMIRLSRCRDVRLEDFTYRDCGAWGCHLRNCDGVVVRRVRCVSHVNNTNDGIDVESSNVLIEDCDIDSDDDAIVFKTESDLSFQVTNVIVRNCRLASCCNALKFGTGSYCDFRGITVEDCVFSRAKYNYRFEWLKLAPGVTNAICGIAGMALEVVDGGRMDNVVIRNIDIEGYQTPIFIREERRHEPQPGRETYLRKVLIEHVKGVADSRIACSITGTPGRRPSDITLRNVDLTFPGGGTEEDVARPVPELETAYPDSCMFGFKPLPAFGFYLRHADDVTFENVSLRTLAPDARKPIVAEDCNGFRESAAGVIQGDLLRPDVPGCPLLTDARMRWNAKTGCFEPNTDESKVAPYVLEDPLTFANGEKLRSAEDWPKRRAEILDIFARKIYGEEPPPPAALSWDLLEEKDGAIAGYAKRRVYRMHFTADKSGPTVDWGLWLPRHAKGRVPVVLFLNYRGIQEIDGDKSIPLCRGWSRRRPSLGVPEHLATEGTRGVLQDADNPSHLPIQTILARGYAILSASYTDVSPDPDPFGADGVDQYAFATTNGVFTLWGTRDESRTDNITSLGAWAWALSRGLDLALAQPEIDPNRTVVTGCSRLGKAAFLAAARDERFAVCVPNQCGGGGVCLAKRDFGENVSTENAMFTHWYCKAYRRYAANPAVLMDFDMHLLLAAIAPRRVLVEGFGPNDWMDTKAEYLAAVAASPAWEFLGVPGLPKVGFPDYYDESAIGPYLGYVRRTEGHGISGYDWNWMLNFADAAWTDPYQETVVLSNGFGRVVLSLEGGRLLSWTDADGREVLFMPENKVTPNGDWSHGGIPLCWPWFGRKDGIIHGFIRNKHMSVRRRTANSVTVGYSLAAGEEKAFPYAADLELVLTLDERLTLSLRTKNIGEESFSHTAGFHPYFKVGTYRQVSFADVGERPFACVDGMDKGFERRPDGMFSFADASLNRRVRAQACGNSHVIVWTPGTVEPANRNLKLGETEEFIGYGPALTKAAGSVILNPGDEKELVLVIETGRMK